MKYARIINNLVIETFIPPAGVPIEECFTPEIVAQFESVPEEVEQNWIKQGDGTFVAPPPPVVEPEAPAGETVLVRARNEDGTYVADDPATPQDEAYVEVPISEA